MSAAIEHMKASMERGEFPDTWEKPVRELMAQVERLREVKDADTSAMQHIADLNARLLQQLEQLREALDKAAEGLDMAVNRFRKMGIFEEADRYFPYLHAVDAALAATEPQKQGEE